MIAGRLTLKIYIYEKGSNASFPVNRKTKERQGKKTVDTIKLFTFNSIKIHLKV